MAISNRLARLEKAKAAGEVLPIVIVTFNKNDDGLYRYESGQTFTPAEFEEFEKTRQVIVVQYGPWPPAGKTLATIGDIDWDRA